MKNLMVTNEDREGKVKMKPKYRVIAELIQQKIVQDYYHEMEKLPTEDEFIEEYGVSRTTIRKALDMLVQNGLIIPRQGSGFFIRKIAKEGFINLEIFKGLSADVASTDIQTKVIDFQKMVADEHLAQEMKCEIGTPLYFVKRLRCINQRKSIIEYSYFNKNLIPYLNEEIISNSIYQYIQCELNLEIHYVDRIIEARYLTDDEATLLNLPPLAPALISTNYATLKNGQIFDYSIDVYHYQNIKFLKLSNFH